LDPQEKENRQTWKWPNICFTSYHGPIVFCRVNTSSG